MRHLGFTYLQEICKIFSVCTTLIKHNDKFGVGKHCSCRMALQKIINVLSNTRAVCTVFTNSFPKCEKKIRRVFVLKEKIYFINENVCFSALRTVFGYTVKNTVKNNKHTDRHKLAAEFKYVVAYKSVLNINICFLCKSAV